MPTVSTPMGNPPMRPDGTVTNATSPVPATPANAALASRQPMTRGQLEDRLPKVVQPRDQAIATGATPGPEERAATAQPLPPSSAQLMNAAGPRRT